MIDDNSKDASGIQVIDDKTIKFVLDQPNAQILPTTFAVVWISPKHPFDGHRPRPVRHAGHRDEPVHRLRPVQDDGVQREAVRQFRGVRRVRERQRLPGLPRADKISIRIYEDANTQLTSTQAGEVDFQYFRRPSGDQLKQLQAIQGMSAQKSLVGFNIFYSFNLNDPGSEKILDPKFRQATVWALDRDTLVNDVLGGVFKVPDIMNHWIAPWATATTWRRTTPRTSRRPRRCWPKWAGTAATS